MGSSKNKKKQGGDNESRGGFHFHDKVIGTEQTFIDGNVDELNIRSGIPADQLPKLAELIQPIRELAESAPPEVRPEVKTKVEELQSELTKGEAASEKRLNSIIDGLVQMVPGALGAIVTMFGNPILSALVGPTTKLVLDRINK